ncbi:hypothetical protein M2271_007900 [Streptomyces sp. LBL]|uniref:hypothetical protein n=1 Tax=Streptomyces sp. LBL TaxID=2940562 RepID=UPI002476E5E0|nr:hypothetical protein [Streptomyces sp. LBL]MDH6630050.1 hypothetical protein [Streptomyces sp. LBL]
MQDLRLGTGEAEREVRLERTAPGGINRSARRHAEGDFDTYWAWHENQEFTRNHKARYRGTLIPAA